MKQLMSTLALVLCLGSIPAYATDTAPAKEPSPAQKAQQEKMKACNQEARDKALKGDERKAFMKTCLSAKPAPQASQQDKMKQCNQQAGEKGLKGDERKAFMSDCLKN
ncbi:PsiF family protein [Azovibrio restrictus]|uniref:PsiF family protein n=1 Tax=Azovibrio restrictus TaxID=146938 RepID=UPI0026F30544|nr:PsiF family protein [Azovibrio restrictus]